MSRAKLTAPQAQLAVWIRADLKAKLTGRAEEEKRSQKDIVEEALEAKLEPDDDGDPARGD